jgi:hypothetical protein
VEGAEGKIKADGSTLDHRAKSLWSAHWLGDGVRHHPKGVAVPRLGETSTFAQLFAALRVVLLCFWIDRLHRRR